MFAVALRELKHRLRQRGFWLTAVGTPVLLIVISVFTGGFGGDGSAAPTPEELAAMDAPVGTIGYVDQADLIETLPEVVPADHFRRFPTVEAAEAALDGGEIGAYYVIPAEYRRTGDVRRVSPEMPMTPPDTEWINWILVSNLFPEASTEELARLRNPFGGAGPQFVSLSAEGETGTGDSMLPFLVTIAIIIPLFTSGSLLFQSLAQEKESRVMEILLVSLRPRQLLAGKLLGLGVVTLAQYAIWAALGGVALAVTGRGAGVLSAINLSPGELAVVIPYALGGYTLYAALMAGVGALAPDMESSRAWIFVLNVPMMIPLYLWAAITSAPNGALATVLSMVPFSAPVAMLMRMTSSAVPAWQLGLSLGLLVLTGIGMVWLMARLFRAQTLLSGEALSLRRFWGALRS
jgi:ABC-2 type transport system permease protein